MKDGDTQDIQFMKEALKQAAIAEAEGEVPVGAVIVKDGQIISTGRNRREKQKNALCHAEIEAIGNACSTLGGWRLPGCTLYVTLEPCPMCAGAIINSRIERVVFGAYDNKNGCCGSVTDLFSFPFNHFPKSEGGVLEKECGDILSSFFKRLRSDRCCRTSCPTSCQPPNEGSTEIADDIFITDQPANMA